MPLQIPKINERNEILGATTVEEADANDWYRRVVRVFLFDKQGHILLQRRSQNIIGYPGMWDQAAGGLIDVGEQPMLAAKRETREELGIDVNLTEIVAAHKINYQGDRQFCYIYKDVLQTGVTLTPDSHDVATVQWMTIKDFEQMIFDNERAFVPAFVQVWRTFRDKLIGS